VQHTSKFVFQITGQDGRIFWGELASLKVKEGFIGAISVDENRFVMTDSDGSYSGTIVDANTLDYCYTHVAPNNVAVACGLLVREQ